MHFGSKIGFVAGRHPFMTVGERNDPDRAQEVMTHHAGKIFGFNDDGSVPKDNPFVGKDGVRPEIYSTGIGTRRDPHFDLGRQVVGQLTWPLGGDESNLIQPGPTTAGR